MVATDVVDGSSRRTPQRQVSALFRCIRESAGLPDVAMSWHFIRYDKRRPAPFAWLVKLLESSLSVTCHFVGEGMFHDHHLEQG